MKSKICTKCKKEHPATLEYFMPSKSRLDGLFSWCRNCKKESDRKYHRKNIKRIKKQCKEWRKNHKEITKIRDQEYRKRIKNRKSEDILVPNSRKCPRCKKIKPSKNFYKNTSSIGGLSTFCKKCTNYKNRKSYKKFKEKRKEQDRQYRIANKEKIARRAKYYYLKNKVRIQKYKSKWHIKNREKVSERCKIWSKNNKEYIRQYANNKRKTDLNYRILNNLRGRLYYALKAQGSSKADHTKELLGCSINDLKHHMQLYFLKGMTFDNYGRDIKGWSIDHIKPCAMFNLSDFKQQKACFHYTNLQPLWNIDNAHKNSFYNGKYIRKTKKENKSV